MPPGHVPVSWLRGRVVGEATVTARCAQVGHSRSLAWLRRELAALVVRHRLEDLDGSAIRLRAPRAFAQHVSRYVYECTDKTVSLLALANRDPLVGVAARHGLSYDAVRQRVTRGPQGIARAIVMDASDGAVSVRVTATPGALEIDPGDGRGAFTCTSQLAYDRTTSYYDQVPGEPRGACVHVYQQVFTEVTATMSVSWTITYQGFAPELGGLSGSLGTQTRQQTATFPVQEIQSVIVR